jgi:hypothetical protein
MEIFFAMILGGACPLGGQILTSMSIDFPGTGDRGAFYIGQIVMVLVILLFALLVLALTMATFNRCIGRMPERPRRPPRPPRRATGPRGPHLKAAEVRWSESVGTS